jgi:hypothetical protein
MYVLITKCAPIRSYVNEGVEMSVTLAILKGQSRRFEEWRDIHFIAVGFIEEISRGENGSN